MKINRTHIATGGTLAALGVLAAVALGSGGEPASSKTTAAAVAPQVRTEVIRRTERVRAKGAEPGSSRAPASPAPAPPAAPPVAAAAAPAGDDGPHHEGHDDDHGRGRGRGRGGDDDGGRGRGRGRGGDDHGGDDD